jgi:hypothetical protein
LDVLFEEEWKYIRNRILERKLQVCKFEELWKALVHANNDWRRIESDGNFIYCRAKGLRLNTLINFKRNDDYFVGKQDLVDFVKEQIQFRQEEEFLVLFEEGNRESFVEQKKGPALVSKQKVSQNVGSEGAYYDIDFETSSDDSSILFNKADSRVHSSISSKSFESKSLSKFQSQNMAKSPPEIKENDPSLRSELRAESYSWRKPSSFAVGDEIDVAVDDVYCPATIIEVGAKHVRVHYLGWEDESYDANIRDMSCLYPPYSYVQRVKIWAGLCDKIQDWPCVAYIRPAVNDCADGISYLKTERCVFVMPVLSHLPELARWCNGRWLDTFSLRPFSRIICRKRLLPSPLEQELERAMSTLESDSSSRSVHMLRFFGSYELYTSMEIWSPPKSQIVKSIVGIKRPVDSDIVKTSEGKQEKSAKKEQVFISKRRRFGNIVIEKEPVKPECTYLTICSSVAALRQLNSQIHVKVQETQRNDDKCYSKGQGQFLNLPETSRFTFLVEQVGCRRSLTEKWKLS